MGRNKHHRKKLQDAAYTKSNFKTLHINNVGETNAQNILVPNRRRRILPEVVLVRRWVIGVLGIWRGEG
jgi:hypothetical protein